MSRLRISPEPDAGVARAIAGALEAAGVTEAAERDPAPERSWRRQALREAVDDGLD